jgi:hypothetical protein
MMDFLLIFAAISLVGYPVHGAVIHGDPWTWVFKKEPTT